MTRMTVVAVLLAVGLSPAARAENYLTWNRWLQDAQESPAPGGSPMAPAPTPQPESPAVEMYHWGGVDGPSCCSGWWANYCAQRRWHCGCGVHGVRYAMAGCGKAYAGCDVCLRCRHHCPLAFRRLHCGYTDCGCAAKLVAEPACCFPCRPLGHRCRRVIGAVGSCGCSMGDYLESPTPDKLPDMMPPQPEPSPADGPTT